MSDASQPGSQYNGTVSPGAGGSLSTTGTGHYGGDVYVPPSSVVIGVGPQTFRVTCTGLKPSTLHKAYLLAQDVTINCAPIVNGNITSSSYTFGANLVTDSTGFLQFDYAFTPQNSPYTTQVIAALNETIAIIPAGNQNFKVSSTDGNSHAESFIISKGTISS